MSYLLDVNALVALGFLQHEFHDRVAHWLHGLLLKGGVELATCSITELGFVRVLMQIPQSRLSILQARKLLLRLKEASSVKFRFIADNQDSQSLPAWVKTARQTTDGHLVQLARSQGSVFATLDRKIPRAFLIPSGR